MPTTYKPTRVCKVSGCTAPTMSTGWCVAHDAVHNAPKPKDRQRDADGLERDAFYGTTAWKRIRAAHRSRHPMCEGCLLARRSVSVEFVDHVLPIREAQEIVGPTLNIRALPLQSLCRKCHAAKWSMEKRRIVWDARTPPGVTMPVEEFVEHLKSTGEWSLITGETAYQIG